MSTTLELCPPSREAHESAGTLRREPRPEVPILCARLLPCPCCGTLQTGFPVAAPSGGQTSEYAGAAAWKFRLDLIGWVCPTCHVELGPDQAREAAIAACQN